MQKKGFTLIELLVVIAIIGLLATMSVVSFSTSREKGRIAKGASLEGQILRSTGDDTIARWDVDECSGGTVADSSGNNNNLSLVSGATFSTNTPSKQGCSLELDGTNQITRSVPSIGAQQTKTMWVYIVGPVTGNQYLLDEGANNNSLNITSSRVRVFGSGGSLNVSSNMIVTTNKWYFIATTYDGTATSIYIDGSLDKKQNSPGEVATGPITIGNYGGGGGYRFTGNLKDIRIFNRSLSGKEIHQMYADNAFRYLAIE